MEDNEPTLDDRRRQGKVLACSELVSAAFSPLPQLHYSPNMFFLSCSQQHEAGLFEYVVKMSHGDGRKKSSNRFIPVRYRPTVHPWVPNTALVATPDVLKEFEKERSSSDDDVPPVKLRPVSPLV